MTTVILGGVPRAARKSGGISLAALGALLRRTVKAWRYRSDIHRLQGMSDRQLSDIGLSRSQIEQAVCGGAADDTRRR